MLKKSAKYAVVEELRNRGTAKSVEIARALDLKPSTVGYIMYQLRQSGAVQRIRTGVHRFVRIPDDLHYWDDGFDGDELPVPEGKTMPQRVLSLLAKAPRGALSFTAIWKLTGLERNVVGAVLSDLSKRGRVTRVRRGLYRLGDDGSSVDD